ncbi:hypothetical protein MMC30_007677 [Trapelia coarctata]|nr:hypothetical protein [Trapelia coarctata]
MLSHYRLVGHHRHDPPGIELYNYPSRGLTRSLEYFRCQWTLNGRTTESEKRLSRTIDLVISRSNHVPSSYVAPTQAGDIRTLNVLSESTDNKSANLVEFVPSGSQAFLLKYLEFATSWNAGRNSLGAFKFVLPDADGYVVRSDFIERRLDGCGYVSKAAGFLSPLQRVKSAFTTTPKSLDFPSLISSAVGAVLVQNLREESIDATLRTIETELNNRLSFSWLLPDPIPRKRLAWVEGRRDVEVSRRMYEAAWALGITLVMLDNPSHWLQDDNGAYAYFREAFVPVNITADEGFVERVVNAIRSYAQPIDGIMTVSDARVMGVAKACEILGLPTSPSAAYTLAADKYKTRMMEPTNDQAFQVSSISELRERLNSGNHMPLSYPRIVKPCFGWGSECVAKVSNEAELLQAMERASARHASSPQRRTDVLIEPYIDGPEIDANFVLLNKEVVFFEIADDFPSPGDGSSASSTSNFLETQIVFPSRLSAREIATVRNSIHQSILRMGFVSGTFHCEARIQYSSSRYVTEGDTFDLYPKPDAQKESLDPVVYLLEINARPAGYPATIAVLLTYGVDYFAQQMLFSIADEARFKALIQPFLHGPQYTLLIQFIPQERAGVMKTEDAGLQLYEKYPDLMANVPEHKTWVKKGDVLKGPEASELLWLAQFLVVSRDGRKEVLRLGQEIRDKFQYELE